MEDLIIRKIEESEFKQLSLLATKTFFDTFTGTCTPEDLHFFLEQNYNEACLKEISKKPNIEIWVAIKDGTMVAYTQLHLLNTMPELKGVYGLEIQRLYVSQDYLRKKIGKRLMDLAHKRAFDCKSKVLWLGVWEHNERAKKFYESTGFQVFGSHPFPIGGTPQTDLWMKKDL